MKKFFKSFTIMLIAVCAAVACAFAVTACNNNNEPSYTFLIQYEDGSAVNGQTGGRDGGKLFTQICEVGELGQCVALSAVDIYPDESGKLTITQSKVNELFGSEEDVTEFSFHVVYVPDYNNDCEFEVNGVGEYACKLYK